jgi:hypothetical protein
MSEPKDPYVVTRRFSDWLGEVYDVIEVATGRTVSMCGGADPKAAKKYADDRAKVLNKGAVSR